MTDAVDERERRTRQFEHYVRLMEFRARHLVKGGCFVIFSCRIPPRHGKPISSSERFVQFAFDDDDFYLDMPNSTLTHTEANRAVAERTGFHFILRDTSRKHSEYEREFDPIQRTYEYHELRIAAEDTAYFFFDLWNLPLDTRIRVQARAFEGDKQWERNFMMG